ncbi:mucin-6-like [Scyliorhinus canicula]|uniref:mucin-6-like n=1 Tax=Scyliorhinus canicula TaxID=7830 RepID=UPI0018F75295|nr:mucin-6-like [Scyliorhinus canicula]
MCKVISPLKFTSKYQVDDPSETCHPLNAARSEENYQDYVPDCSCMLNKVAPLCKLPKTNYVSECQRDLYKCTTKGDTQCSCQTLSEYSRQCSRLLEPVTNWRNISFCPPIPCPGNQVYQECGSPCLSTCSNPQTTCDSYGTYGCFCPAGTVLDDISTKDMCIPLSRCPCVLNGQVYAPGGSVISPCKSCKCFMGKWNCINLPCPGRCSIEGGSYVTTFDSKQYRFHGACTYLLVKSFKMLDDGTIEAVFDKCGVRYSETQLTSIIYATNQVRTKIVISKQGAIEVNNKILKLPYEDGKVIFVFKLFEVQLNFLLCTYRNIAIYRQSSSYIQVKSTFGLEIQVQTHPFLQLYIIIDESFATTTHGLCGNFDGVSQNDFRSSMGIQEGTASSFVDSWRVTEHCQSAQDKDCDPCSLSQSNSEFAESYCSILMNKSSIFGRCHCRVDPTDYYERCKFETCNYEQSQKFMCNSIGVYARACAIKGLILTDWRNVVDHCKMSCHGLQVFSYDSKACNRTCFSLSNSILECTESGVPVDGCNCPPNTFLDDTNKCVRASSCPCFLQDGAIVPAGKSVNTFGRTCLMRKSKDFEVMHDMESLLNSDRSEGIVLIKRLQPDLRNFCQNGKIECFEDSFISGEICDQPKIYFNCANAKEDEYGAAYQPTCQMHATETRSVKMVEGKGAVLPAQLSMEQLVESLNNKFQQQGKEALEDLAKVVQPLQATIECVGQRQEAQGLVIHKVKESVGKLEDRLASLETGMVMASQKYLREKLEDLENHPRRQNVRIVGMSEGIEGAEAGKYVASMLEKLMGKGAFDRLSEVDLAHRTLRRRPQVDVKSHMSLLKEEASPPGALAKNNHKVIGTTVEHPRESTSQVQESSDTNTDDFSVMGIKEPSEVSPIPSSSTEKHSSVGPNFIPASGVKNCICIQGKWECTGDAKCPSTCVIHGEGHITTFDGRQYVFDGNCEYTLVQDACSVNYRQPSFKIVSENIICGKTGVVCTKSIKIYFKDILIKLTDGHYQITPPNAARRLKVVSNPLYLKFDLSINAKLELTIIWNKNMNAYISITRLSEFAVCGLCGNYNGNVDDEYITQNKYLVSNVLDFANSWKEDPTCRDVTEVVFPCHKNPYRLARAEKMCAIINSKTFESCHKLVYRMPYYDNCVRDACGCELVGDCECLCDAVSVYAKTCIDAGVCIDWRTPDFCPVYCDYFNTHKKDSAMDGSFWNAKNRWHYQPCLCPANIHIFGKFNMEGKPSLIALPEKPNAYYPPEKPNAYYPPGKPKDYYPPGRKSTCLSATNFDFEHFISCPGISKFDNVSCCSVYKGFAPEAICVQVTKSKRFGELIICKLHWVVDPHEYVKIFNTFNINSSFNLSFPEKPMDYYPPEPTQYYQPEKPQKNYPPEKSKAYYLSVLLPMKGAVSLLSLKDGRDILHYIKGIQMAQKNLRTIIHQKNPRLIIYQSSYISLVAQQDSIVTLKESYNPINIEESFIITPVFVLFQGQENSSEVEAQWLK